MLLAHNQKLLSNTQTKDHQDIKIQNMGSRVGHVLPGSAFLAFGLWHLFNNIKLFCLRPNTFISSPWFPILKVKYLELYLIMFFSSTYISTELFTGPRRNPLDSDGTLPSTRLHNFEHSSISMSILVYAVSAIVLDRARPREAASEGLTFLALAAALTQQIFIFHFHSTDHMYLEGQYHLILQLIIFVSLLTTLMGIALPSSFLVSLVRSSSEVLQGAWLILLGCMLYTPNLVPKGCFIHYEETRQVVKCSTEEALHRAKSLANIEFSWLFVINTIFVVTLYLILDRVYGGKVEYSSLHTNYQREQYDEEQQNFEPQSTQKMRFVQMGKLVEHGDNM